jgi:hypothetical protein
MSVVEPDEPKPVPRRTLREIAEMVARLSRSQRGGTLALPQADWQLLADDLGEERAPKPCTVPPEGWACSRGAGHDGPCAATPVDVVREASPGEELEWQRLELMKATPITFEVACKLWGTDVSLTSDKTRAAFFTVWALAARELADAMMAEVERAALEDAIDQQADKP